MERAESRKEGRIAQHHGHAKTSPAGEVMASATRIKRDMQRAMALVDYYNGLSGRKITSEEELKDVKSKMLFTQKQVLKLCLESKKIIKDMEPKTS